ncbi:hypothetical protein POM88_037214 [Heracleum sosnowskyi]|uniref:Histone-lysine N-methyltransferase CLF-like HTH domain-containing protein n=1 Tax=Heracleum sosnowskyi TaxID=360622 RepID=A0AAD8HPP8_9APIA|nr:hypothetical protein POM88_037214 [Heracleum sosnowskyi]
MIGITERRKWKKQIYRLYCLQPGDSKIYHVCTGCIAYNLGTGRGTSVLEIVAAFEKASRKLCAKRPGDATAVYASTEKTERESLGGSKFTVYFISLHPRKLSKQFICFAKSYKTIAEEHGLSEEVLNVLTHFISGSSSEILECYTVVKRSNEEKQRPNSSSEKRRPDTSTCLEKSLGANLDSLDNLFCRRCLVFDCRLHGCSQGLVNSVSDEFFPNFKLIVYSSVNHCNMVISKIYHVCIGCIAYNLGTGRGTSVLEIVAAFEKASGKKIPVKLCAKRPGDATAVYASTEKTERELGWKSFAAFRTTIPAVLKLVSI